MTEKPKRDFETEWSFSFENIGKSIDKAISSIGDEIQQESFTVEKGDTTSARIVIHGWVGRTTIRHIDTGDNLFEAVTAHAGEIEFSVTGDAQKVITLRPKREHDDLLTPIRRTIASFGNRDELFYDICISPDVPVTLELHNGAGPTRAHLSELNLEALSIKGGVGSTLLTLPTTPAPYSVKVATGLGTLIAYAPEQTHVNLKIEGGAGSNVLHIPKNAAIDLKIEGGIGSTLVHVEKETGIRLKAEIGLGSIQVPDSLQPVKVDDAVVSKSGLWENAQFLDSQQRVNIHFEGGMGTFRIQERGDDATTDDTLDHAVDSLV